jgi:hypothetical protein
MVGIGRLCLKNAALGMTSRTSYGAENPGLESKPVGTMLRKNTYPNTLILPEAEIYPQLKQLHRLYSAKV